MTKIATGETEKGEVVDSTLKLFFDKFINFRSIYYVRCVALFLF